MIPEEKIKETLSGLKDFQKKTVDYVYNQLYANHRNTMLIADEVGLGKTIVAKGIIAKAFTQFKPTSNKAVFNVVYICSNQALAKQNLKKLNFSGDPKAIDYTEDDDRLTSLAYQSPKDNTPFPFRIKAFTPATSFDDKTHAGKADERVLLYRLLYSYQDINENWNSLKWILKGNNRISDGNWEARIQSAHDFDNGHTNRCRPIKPKVYREFKRALEIKVKPNELPKCFAAAGLTYEVKYWSLLKRLCALGIRKNTNERSINFSKELISSLRFILSRVCIEFLQADIFILDEFQRYKKLIETQNKDDEKEEISPAIQIARDIFSYEDSKILMLSATPFKPFTNNFDEMNGEVHYNEFITVLKFLMPDKVESFWKEYEQDRKNLFGYLRHLESITDNIPKALLIKNKLENLYRDGIVRTEKLLASNDRNALVRQVNSNLSIQLEDIQDFIALDQITVLLNKDHNTSLNVPLEYVKSCPFALSFLDNYQHKEKIKKFILNDKKLQSLLQKTKHGWVNLNDISQYKPLIPARSKSLPNAKLRLLLDETVQSGWQYLWVPPSIFYYKTSGAYKESEGFSKTLIFSSWKLVPKMIASLVSYEVERLSIGNPKAASEREKKERGNEKLIYFQKRRSPRPQFTFKVLKEEKEPQQMNNFSLTYPSVYIANIYDPAINLQEGKSLVEIRKELKFKFKSEFNKLNLNQFVSGQGDWQKWFWLAPILFDKAYPNNECVIDWFIKGLPPTELMIDSEAESNDKEESQGKKSHFQLAKEVYFNTGKINAAKLNTEQLDQICEHLANLCIGSPAITYLRTQQRYNPLSVDLLDASYNVASGFLTMMNKPESIAVVRIATKEGDYWERALEYLVEGNIQALLDEFVYLLSNGENIKSSGELSDFICDILSVRTSSSEIDDYKSFTENLVKEKPKKKMMRHHYAVDFGTQKINTAQGAGRQINIRQAFNSPFRPFVLASTSIGQEGLDFHLYCKKIFHWNLPSNPIDFEQREGRINRYQGLVIRLNLAKKYKDEIEFRDASKNTWIEIFKIAEREKYNARFPCDLVPFWHTESVDDIKIDRFVPLYPFSSDIQKYENLLKVLTFYRLTFGQPRQQELIDSLSDRGFDKETVDKLDELIINLSPIRYTNKSIH